MNGSQGLSNGRWESLPPVALGLVAEILARTMFFKEKFDNHPHLVDDNGIDLSVTNNGFHSFFI